MEKSHLKIIEFLKKSVEKGKISHAYLFKGPYNTGKRKVALEFVKILGIDSSKFHPDLIIIDNPVIEISHIRELIHKLSLSPFKSNFKIAIINNAHTMTKEAANALLKTLEEPPEKSILILITSYPDFLLPTIISRLQIINFPCPSILKIKKEILNDEIYKKSINKILTLLNSDLNEKLLYGENIAKDVSYADNVLKYWMIFFRDILFKKIGCQKLMINDIKSDLRVNYSIEKLKDIIFKIKNARLLLMNSSINSKLVLENLMLEI
ncbi:hypothetical protein DRN73_10385 [Candidatus Pacearchaeota archaeon]|nr:MAG: hypothetical protein DRN73_10385 [Candidatus Pacearchaeota archaeon]